MFGISGFELLIIAVFVLIIFGPDKLPELAKQFGKAMSVFRKAQNDMQKVIKAEMYASPLREEELAQPKSEDSTALDKAAVESAQAAWSSTEEDDEEEEEE